MCRKENITDLTRYFVTRLVQEINVFTDAESSYVTLLHLGKIFWFLFTMSACRYYGFRKAFRAAFRNLLDSKNFKGTIILRTITPQHFEPQEWHGRGNCVRTKPYTKEELKLDWEIMMYYLVQVEEFLAAKLEGKKRGLVFKLLDVTEAMRPRADGHPNHFGQPPEMRSTTISDCLSWCLPGPIDLWNELLLQIMKTKGDGRNWSI